MSCAQSAKRLDGLLEGKDQPGVPELRCLMEELFGGSTADPRVLAEQRLTPSRVYRFRIAASKGVRSVVVKRLTPDVAHRNQLVVRRWLPALGLSASGPSLLGAAAERRGRCVWHVYEDFGDRTLAAGDVAWDSVRAAVGLVAQIHARSAGHALLPECRQCGGDLGSYSYTSSLSDAIIMLESTQLRDLALAAGQTDILDRLLERIVRLHDKRLERTEAMNELGGPDVLLHGDLSAANTLVIPTGDRVQVRLIDWDHAAVGSVAYDVSTFLSGFPLPDRPRILELYRESISAFDWELPSPAELNSLFDTAECVRLADSVIWRATAVVDEDYDCWKKLASVEQWFDFREPVLPTE